MGEGEMSEELKPCPFCGGEAKRKEHVVFKYIYCETCRVSIDRADIGDAISAWNRRAALPAAVPDGWRPIETAPKDGTKILIFRSGKVGIGWWDTDKFIKSPMPFWSGTDAHILGKVWAKSKNPTHWMPLPAAPTEAGDE